MWVGIYLKFIMSFDEIYSSNKDNRGAHGWNGLLGQRSQRDDPLAPFIVVVDYMKPLGHPISHYENVQQVFNNFSKSK